MFAFVLFLACMGVIAVALTLAGLPFWAAEFAAIAIFAVGYFAWEKWEDRQKWEDRR